MLLLCQYLKPFGGDFSAESSENEADSVIPDLCPSEIEHLEA